MVSTGGHTPSYRKEEPPLPGGHHFSWTSRASLANPSLVSRTLRAGGRASQHGPTSPPLLQLCPHPVPFFLWGPLQGLARPRPAILSGSARRCQEDASAFKTITPPSHQAWL